MNLVARERTRAAAEMSEKTMTTSSGVSEVTLFSFAARAGSTFSSTTVLACPLACTEGSAGPGPTTNIAARTITLTQIRRTYVKLFFITRLRKLISGAARAAACHIYAFPGRKKYMLRKKD